MPNLPNTERGAHCSQCGTNLNIQELNFIRVRDRLYCSNCAGTRFQHCQICGSTRQRRFFASADGVRIGARNNVHVCNDCINLFSNLNSCSHCGRFDNVRELNGAHICSDCYTRRYVECALCHAPHFRSESRVVTRNRQRVNVCRSCYNTHYGDVIMSSRYTPDPLRFNRCEGENTLYLGVELETQTKNGSVSDKAQELMNFVTQECNNNNLYFKHDGSVNNGFEIVNHPSTLKYIKENFKWNEILSKLNEMQFVSHDGGACGLHVHVNKTEFTAKTKTRLRLFFNVCKDELKTLSRREYFNFCHFEETAHATAERQRILDANDYNYARGAGRYHAVNFNTNSGQTIEFRFFRGTLNNISFWTALEFADAISGFVKMNFDYNYVHSTGAELFSTFAQWCANADNREKYRNLLTSIVARIPSASEIL